MDTEAELDAERNVGNCLATSLFGKHFLGDNWILVVSVRYDFVRRGGTKKARGRSSDGHGIVLIR
jgi:hypothetical protein